MTLGIGNYGFQNMPNFTQMQFGNNQSTMQLPFFNGNGGFNGMNTTPVFTLNCGSSSSSSSSSSKKTEIKDEDVKKGLEIKHEEQKVLQEKLNQLKDAKETVDKTKNADGSSTQRVKWKDQGFWGKAGRVLSNVGTGLLNMAKGLVGYEPDGKWNWKKCVRNVAVGAAILCTGPVGGAIAAIGGTTAAAIGGAIATIPTVACVAGMGIGAYKTASGLYKFAKADENDDKAIDDSLQEAAQGAATGILSAMGYKSMMNAAAAAEEAAAAEAASSGVTGSTAGTTSSSLLSRLVSPFKYSYNKAALYANKINFQTDEFGAFKLDASGNKIAETGNWATRVGKQWWQSAKDTWNYDLKASYEKIFKRDLHDAKLDSSISEMQSRIVDLQRQNGTSVITDVQRVQNEAEIALLKARIQEFEGLTNGTISKADLGGASSNKVLGNIQKEFEVVTDPSSGAKTYVSRSTGVGFTESEFTTYYETLSNSQQAHLQTLAKLSDSYTNMMRQHAGSWSQRFSNKYDKQLSQFVNKADGAAAKKIVDSWNWKSWDSWKTVLKFWELPGKLVNKLQTDYQAAIGGRTPSYAKMATKWLATSPATQPVFAAETFSDKAAPFMFSQTISAEEVAQLPKTIEQIKEEMNKLSKITTKEQLAEYKKQKEAEYAKLAAAETAKAQEAAKAQETGNVA